MGSMMKDEIIGGQLIYPLVDNNWVTDDVVSDKVLTAIKDRGLYISIKLGGYIVVGGQLKQLKALSEVLPKVESIATQIQHFDFFKRQSYRVWFHIFWFWSLRVDKFMDEQSH